MTVWTYTGPRASSFDAAEDVRLIFPGLRLDTRPRRRWFGARGLPGEACAAGTVVFEGDAFPTRAFPAPIRDRGTPRGVTGLDPEPADEKGVLARTVRSGLALAGTLGIPALALWMMTGRLPESTLAGLGAPWTWLVPVFAGSFLLLGSVHGVLSWATERVRDPSSPEDPELGPKRSGPCARCPG